MEKSTTDNKCNYPLFSKLIFKYLEKRKKKGYKKIHDWIKGCGGGFSYDAVRYKTQGKRPPDPTYMFLMKKYLKLTDDEWGALIDAYVLDKRYLLYAEIKEIIPQLKKLSCLPDDDEWYDTP